MDTLLNNIYSFYVIAYLLGSIPFGLIVCFALGKGDIREIGSGNIGATNVARAAGKKIAAMVFLLDAGKGAAAMGIAIAYAPAITCYCSPIYLIGITAVIGHIFPIWLKFKGGKGVSTTFAVLLVAYWPLGVAALGVWIGMYLWKRISSLSALTTMLLLPVLAWCFEYFTEDELFLSSTILAIIVILKHHENIRRLAAKEEKAI